jgi:hypothetical protein
MRQTIAVGLLSNFCSDFGVPVPKVASSGFLGIVSAQTPMARVFPAGFAGTPQSRVAPHVPIRHPQILGYSGIITLSLEQSYNTLGCDTLQQLILGNSSINAVDSAVRGPGVIPG